ncbi:hypothetical protein [Phormidesmis priestleyi]|uniref:hypothetical protein n=1 Tax=Phormidesmis priestleyi TaxID=268141 RepID=UPI00083B2438|nr:hypothetical protein [Phormidesmis priestleyi]
MQSTTHNQSYEQLSSADGQAILERLPERIRNAILDRATEISYPVEAIVEMAIADYIDSHTIDFADCKPGRKA